MSAATTIERALELAAEGRHRSIAALKKTLEREKFDRVDQHLAGTGIRNQLKALIARSAHGDEI